MKLKKLRLVTILVISATLYFNVSRGAWKSSTDSQREEVGLWVSTSGQGLLVNKIPRAPNSPDDATYTTAIDEELNPRTAFELSSVTLKLRDIPAKKAGGGNPVSTRMPFLARLDSADGESHDYNLISVDMVNVKQSITIFSLGEYIFRPGDKIVFTLDQSESSPDVTTVTPWTLDIRYKVY